jgi:hypothetical protein
LTVAVVGAVAIVVAQVIGQGIATFFGTRAAARVSAAAARHVAAANAESAKRIEEIKAEAQRTFERERDRRRPCSSGLSVGQAVWLVQVATAAQRRRPTTIRCGSRN